MLRLLDAAGDRKKSLGARMREAEFVLLIGFQACVINSLLI